MNTNYKKDFVPYEEALALKEIGFDERCMGHYWEGLFYFQTTHHHPSTMPNSSESCLAPLYQQAFRWFREKYNIDAWVQPFTSEKSNGDLYLPDETYSYFIFKYGVWVGDGVDFLEPEEAELECLKKLIEIVKKQL
jgi:hypothetical protein